MLSYFVSFMIYRTSCTDKHFFQKRLSERVSESNLLVFLIPLKAEEYADKNRFSKYCCSLMLDRP